MTTYNVGQNCRQVKKNNYEAKVRVNHALKPRGLSVEI